MEGLKFNRLTVINYSHTDNYRQKKWNCVCDCGKSVIASTNSLRRNNTKSCGCLQKEKAAISGRNSATTHGLSKNVNGTKTRLFRIWMGMKTRCYNQKVKEYPRYGGKGVIICKEWLDYKNFHDWSFLNGYQDHLTIERIEVSGNYEPNNCRWATMKEQANNRTTSHYLTYNNKTNTMAAFSEEYNIGLQTLFRRLKSGWSVEKALTHPVKILNRKKPL